MNDRWHMVADDILAVLLQDEPGFDFAVYQCGLRPFHLPPGNAEMVARAVFDLRAARKPVHDTTVVAQVSDLVDVKWVAQRMALYDTTRTGDVLRENIQQAQEFYRKEALKKVMRMATDALNNGKPSVDVMDSLTRFMQQTSVSGVEMRSEHADEHGKDFQLYLDTPPGRVLPIGLPWMDMQTGGMEGGMLWWIASAYKQRKTTLMLNMILGLLMNTDASVAFYSREMSRRQITAYLCAMLAVAWLKANGLYDTVDDKAYPVNLISQRMLMIARAKYRDWYAPKRDAVDFSIRQYQAWGKRLRVYDTTPEGGGLSDIGSLQQLIARDIVRDKGRVHFIDYAQLFDVPGANSEHEQLTAVSRACQALAKREDVALVLAAQKNEAGIAAKSSYSPNVSGGGKAAQTADYLFETRYKFDTDMPDSELHVKLKLSRHGSGGDDVREIFHIHPSSGLLLDATWINKCKESKNEL